MTNGSPVTVEVPYTLLSREILEKLGAVEGYRVVAYGSYPCDWNGGRTFLGNDAYHLFPPEFLFDRDDKAGREEMRRVGQKMVREAAGRLNSRRIPFYATMTNIEPMKMDDIGEAFDILDMLADSLPGENGVIIAHPEIRAAVEGRYGPKGKGPLKYVCSVISHYTTPGFSYENALQDHDLVVLKPEDAGDFPSAAIPHEWAPRLVVLANHHCQRNCSNAVQHYRNISLKEKSYMDPFPEMANCVPCSKSNDLALYPGDVARLREAGITNFKMGRRNHVPDALNRLFPELGAALAGAEEKAGQAIEAAATQ